MDELNWETIALIFVIIGYLNDVFDLADHVVDLVKLAIRGVKWNINKIQNERKK